MRDEIEDMTNKRNENIKSKELKNTYVDSHFFLGD